MIEIQIREFLERKLPVPVYMEFPEKPPTRFVVVQRTDGSRENLIDLAKLVADAYAESMYQAAVLNEQVKELLDRLTELPEVCSSVRVTDYPHIDTSNKRYRYQAVQNITHY